VALLLSAFVMTAPGGTTASSAAGPAVASLVVTPATDLVDHQEVAVNGSGFGATFLSLLVCPTGTTAVDGCGSASPGTWVESDPDGTVTTTVTVNARIFGPDHSVTVDCRDPGACELVAFDLLASYALAARAPLHFDPTAPLTPSPTIAVHPATDLVDGTDVEVSGSGFRPDEGASVVICADHGGEEVCRYPGWFPADATGTFTQVLRLRTILRGWTPDGPVEVDCRTTTCTARALSDHGLWSNPVPLHFDPTAPLLPPPTVVVTPPTDLVDGDVVTVAVGGFSPDAYLDVEVCVLDPEGVRLGCTWKPGLSADGSGAGTTSFAVRARLRAWDADADLLDCRAQACTVTVTDHASDDRAVAPLPFAPDGPLLPPPVVTVAPTDAIVDGETVTVTGSGFVPGEWVDVQLCVTATTTCDHESARSVPVDSTGAMTVDLRLRGTFDHWTGETVDCRTAPGCEVVARASEAPDEVRVPVTFAPPPPPRGRWLDPVFDEVEVTNDVVYRTTIDSRGNTVDLKMDIYRPVGDPLTRRPALMWMHGGWFIFGNKSSMADYATESARRGYVGISLQYRLRPEITPADLPGVVEAAGDAYDDATAAVEWLIANAATYGIDPRAVLVGGYSAGGVLSWNLSYLPGEHGPDDPLVAGAAPIAGIPFTGPEPGDPPIIGFHATDDDTVPVSGGRERCAEAVLIAVVCEWIEYPTGGHGIVSSEFRDIVRRSHDFFFAQVLEPLGYRTTSPDAAPPVRPDPGPGAPDTTPVPPTAPAPSTTAVPPTTPAPSTAPIPSPTTVPVSTTVTTAPVAPPHRGDPAGPPTAPPTAPPARPRPAAPHYTG
jgi:predicted esterase